ncbi:MAG: hypothetical protein M1826_003603 [Phylliscum demangeonii]|nr:MAG: hypothetical protein M1826_003603 [Phylliscum demangeonii]
MDPGDAIAWHKDMNFRLDRQGITTGPPKEYNLQVQVNMGCPDDALAGLREYNLQVQVNKDCNDKALKRWAPNTVAKALISVDSDMAPDQIREALLEGILEELKD